MWKLSVVVAHQSTGKLFPAAGLYGGELDFPGISRCYWERSKFLWGANLWAQGSGVPSVWLLGCFKSNGVSLELSILVFGYFSIQFYVLLMPQEISVGPVGVTVGMKQIRCFLHLIFDKCVFLAHLSHFWCNKCFVEHLEIQRKGLGRSGLVSIADPWDFCSTGPKHMGSNHSLGVFIGFLGARNSSCSVKLNPLWRSI